MLWQSKVRPRDLSILIWKCEMKVLGLDSDTEKLEPGNWNLSWCNCEEQLHESEVGLDRMESYSTTCWLGRRESKKRKRGEAE